MYYDPTGHGPEEQNFYRRLEAQSNKKLRAQSSTYYVSGFDDGDYHLGFTGGYPTEFVTGRNVTSEDRALLNEKVFGNQRFIDIIYTMRYATDKEFKKAVDEDNATDWNYEGMVYGAKKWPYALVDTIIELNNNKPVRSDSPFAQYSNPLKGIVKPMEFAHKVPISYQNQQKFYNRVWETQVGLDMALNVVTLGADWGIEALSAGRTVSSLVSESDDVLRYMDDAVRGFDFNNVPHYSQSGVPNSLEGIDLPSGFGRYNVNEVYPVYAQMEIGNGASGGKTLIVKEPKIFSKQNLTTEELNLYRKNFNIKKRALTRAAKNGQLKWSPNTDDIRISELQKSYRDAVSARYKRMFGKEADLSRLNADHPVDLIVGGSPTQRLKMLDETINKSVGASLKQSGRKAGLTAGDIIDEIIFVPR